jgi:periodic tryptophan protein 2
VTIDNIIAKVKSEQYLTALVLALRLGERQVTQTVYSCIPVDSVPLLCAHFPTSFLEKLLQFLAEEIEASFHIEWAMVWISNLLRFHG